MRAGSEPAREVPGGPGLSGEGGAGRIGSEPAREVPDGPGLSGAGPLVSEVQDAAGRRAGTTATQPGTESW